MPPHYEDEEMPLPLVRRSSRPPRAVAQRDLAAAEAEDSLPLPPRGRALEVYDRMSPAMAGGLMGLLAGGAGLGVVHLMERTRMDHAFAQAAAQRGLGIEIAVAVGYVTAAALGALVGACFATVTRHLRRLFPLILWAVIFFVSLTMLVLAVSRSYGNTTAGSMAPAVLAAAAAYAFVAAFQLPLRRKSPPRHALTD
jgi:hypothetical protein